MNLSKVKQRNLSHKPASLFVCSSSFVFVSGIVITLKYMKLDTILVLQKTSTSTTFLVVESYDASLLPKNMKQSFNLLYIVYNCVMIVTF